MIIIINIIPSRKILQTTHRYSLIILPFKISLKIGTRSKFIVLK